MQRSASQSLSKQYYRIGEVSRIVGVQPHVLRYWETEFRTIRPEKSSSGQRVYSKRDVEKLLCVRDLLKNQGFSIRGARKQLHTQGVDSEIAEHALQRLQPSAPSGVVAPADGRALRKTLLQLRSDLIHLLAELEASERSDA